MSRSTAHNVDALSLESSESEPSSEDESDTEVEAAYLKPSRLVSPIFEHIASLCRVSVLLRRPTVREKYIRSVPSGEEVLFEDWEKQHILEKTTLWARNWSNATDGSSTYGLKRANPLVASLATANCRRRAQLRFWQKNPELPRETSQAPKIDKANSQPTRELPQYAEKSSGRTVKTEQKTSQSFSTIAASALNDNATTVLAIRDNGTTVLGRSKTVYTQSTSGNWSILRIPEVPDVPEGILVFECPYCLAELDVGAMQKRIVWKSVFAKMANPNFQILRFEMPTDLLARRHVFRDLRPYSCTFPDCDNAGKLYVRRHECINHEMQMHHRQ